MRIIGIDPGLSGGIAILDDLKIFDLFDMPIMSEGKKNKNQLNSAQLVNIVRNHILSSGDTFVIVEQVSAMPGQGVTSMFNFGQTFGAIKGICASLYLPIFYVRPANWKKHFDLINASKDASRTKVIEMYPSISDRLRKKKDLNKAAAILIARYFKECKAQFAEKIMDFF